MELPKYLRDNITFSAELEEQLKVLLEKKEFSKGQFLFQQGQVCHQMFLIEKGFARIFYISNTGKEITAWFSTENDFVTPIDTFDQ